jgi:hypothetical protein
MGALSNQLTTEGNCCNQAITQVTAKRRPEPDYLRYGDVTTTILLKRSQLHGFH